jgi:hypothetical protein
MDVDLGAELVIRAERVEALLETVFSDAWNDWTERERADFMVGVECYLAAIYLLIEPRTLQ